MPVILGVLAAVVTILVLLKQLADHGIGLGGLNPFLWRRRRNWQKQFSANPVFLLEDPKDVAALRGSSAHILGDPDVLLTQLDAVLAKGRDRFTSEQVVSTLAMMERVAQSAGAPSERQRELIEGTRSRLSRMQPAKGTWT